MAAAVQRIYSKKLALLFDHFGIEDKTDMASLAWALVVEHVPGFKVQFPESKPNVGRKVRWPPERLWELYETVQSVKRQHKYTDRHALTFIAKNQAYAAIWGTPPDHKGSTEQWIETLEARLQDAKRLQKRYEETERELKAATADFMKFRK
jgi:hypothetical protein